MHVFPRRNKKFMVLYIKLSMRLFTFFELQVLIAPLATPLLCPLIAQKTCESNKNLMSKINSHAQL